MWNVTAYRQRGMLLVVHAYSWAVLDNLHTLNMVLSSARPFVAAEYSGYLQL